MATMCSTTHTPTHYPHTKGKGTPLCAGCTVDVGVDMAAATATTMSHLSPYDADLVFHRMGVVVQNLLSTADPAAALQRYASAMGWTYTP